ncbi:hypothetical protein A6R68_03455, partial [Neotoma lepida]
YTEGEAKKRGVVGWVKNTSKGTVTGQLQGPKEKVDSMIQEELLYCFPIYHLKSPTTWRPYPGPKYLSFQ